MQANETAGRGGFLLVLGLASGFASAFLGIGGGLVIVPVLMIALHYPIKRAVGTSLAAIVPISMLGVLAESIVKWRNIHWTTALILAVGSLLGSWAGGVLLPRIADTPLRLAYAAFLGLAAYRMLASAGSENEAGLLALDRTMLVGRGLTVAVGALAGLSSVLFGIGGGIVMVPALSLLFDGFPFHAARATSLVTIVPTSAFGAWQHWGMRTVDLSIARRLVPAGLAGSLAGVLTVNRLPARPCRILFGAFLVLAVARLLTLGGRNPFRRGR